MTTETCAVSRARLDALACRYMDEIHDRCGHTPKSLDEFLAEYPLSKPDRKLGEMILGLFPEYGGENDPV